MISLQKFLENNKFRAFDKCIDAQENCVNFGTIKFDILKGEFENETGWLYLWVIEKQKEPILILYVGKTDQPINLRMGDHWRGSKLTKDGIPGNKKGYKNATYLRMFSDKYRQSEYQLRVYCRLSGSIYLLNHEITLCNPEESSLIKVICDRPSYCDYLLNDLKLKKAKVKKAKLNPDKWLEKVENFLQDPVYMLPDYRFPAYEEFQITGQQKKIP